MSAMTDEELEKFAVDTCERCRNASAASGMFHEIILSALRAVRDASAPAPKGVFVKPAHERCDWQSAAPQVDATLEGIARELRDTDKAYAKAFGGLGSWLNGLADALSAHARKANDGVNRRLLKAAKDLLGGHVWGAHGWSSTGHLSICSFQGGAPFKCAVCGKTVRMMAAIRAAESAAPGEDLEARIGVLKYAASICDSKNLSFKNEGYRAACDEIKICLLASVERLEAGERIEAVAHTQQFERKEGRK